MFMVRAAGKVSGNGHGCLMNDAPIEYWPFRIAPHYMSILFEHWWLACGPQAKEKNQTGKWSWFLVGSASLVNDFGHGEDPIPKL
jgi:hypothetical protein